MEKMDDGGLGGGYPRRFKHIMIGLDGTWQAAYRDIFHSNVFSLNVALNYQDNSSNNNSQIFIYSSGLGTTNETARLMAGALGDGLNESVLQAYINIVSNYTQSDKLYIFGFSRGAVAARALSGFITYAGLLKAEHAALIEDAWRFYTNEQPRINYAAQRAAVTHENVEIEFLGVWDTVTGPYKKQELMQRYRFENLKLDRSVKCGVHILSIDESRRDFEPLLWTGRSSERQTLEQIWIPGVHGDIGGGYEHQFLSTLSLLLMIDRLAHHQPQLGFDENLVENLLLRNLIEQKIVINDEWAGYPTRALKKFTGAPRAPMNDRRSMYYVHPFTRLILNAPVLFKGRQLRYRPTVQMRGFESIQDLTFSETSWYQRKIAQLLREKLADS
jgi:type VI secretion system (T6SS) phospholipase Tle1-like effector